MDELSRAILAALPPTSGLAPRTVVSVSPLQVDVNGAARGLVNGMGGELVRVGDTVLVASSGGTSRAIANLSPLPRRGTVTAVGSGTVTVSVGGLSVVLAYAGAVPAVADTVGVVWAEGGSWCAKLSTASVTGPGAGTAPPVGADPPPASKAYTLTVPAITVASAEGSSWTTWGSYGTTAVQGAYTGTNYKTGYFFYGAAFGGPAGRTCTAAKLVLKRGPSGLGSSAATPAHVWVHGGVTKGSTPPALIGGEAYTSPGFLFGEVQTLTLPTSVGQAFLDGTAAGIALAYSGTAHYAQWRGIADFAAAGQLSLSIQEA